MKNRKSNNVLKVIFSIFIAIYSLGAVNAEDVLYDKGLNKIVIDSKINGWGGKKFEN